MLTSRIRDAVLLREVFAMIFRTRVYIVSWRAAILYIMLVDLAALACRFMLDVVAVGPGLAGALDLSAN